MGAKCYCNINIKIYPSATSWPQLFHPLRGSRLASESGSWKQLLLVFSLYLGFTLCCWFILGGIRKPLLEWILEKVV